MSSSPSMLFGVGDDVGEKRPVETGGGRGCPMKVGGLIWLSC